MVIDERGRLRARWNGYRPGVEAEIAARVRQVLDGSERPDNLAEVLVGGELLDVVWSRDIGARAEGVVTIDAPEGGLSVLVSAGRRWVRYDAAGRVSRRGPGHAAAGSLRRVDTAAVVVGFRPGSRRIVALDLAADTHEVWEMQAPVLALEPLKSAGATAGRLLVGTTDGLYTAAPDGSNVAKIDGVDATAALAVLGDDRGAAFLRADGSVGRLDPSLEPSGDAPGLPSARRLVGAAGVPGLGLATGDAAAIVFVRSREDRQPLIAVATTGGQLVVIDPRDGTTLVRARWRGLTDLAVGDLDGDGSDELIVAAGRRVTVIRLGSTTRDDNPA
jgi:hypothetical protein